MSVKRNCDTRTLTSWSQMLSPFWIPSHAGHVSYLFPQSSTLIGDFWDLHIYNINIPHTVLNVCSVPLKIDLTLYTKMTGNHRETPADGIIDQMLYAAIIRGHPEPTLGPSPLSRCIYLVRTTKWLLSHEWKSWVWICSLISTVSRWNVRWLHLWCLMQAVPTNQIYRSGSTFVTLISKSSLVIKIFCFYNPASQLFFMDQMFLNINLTRRVI